MTTGAKVAIGCGIAFVVAGMAVAAAVFGGLWWAKGKAEHFTANETRIDDLKKKANAVPFTRPADGLIREDRLVKFLEVRKRIFDVYIAHKDEMDAMSKKKEGDFNDLRQGLGIYNEVRLAQAQALADVGMSQEEYGFLVEQVYKTMMASVVAQESGGKSVSQVAGETYDAVVQTMEQSRQAAEKLKQEQGGSNLTPEQRKLLEQTQEAARNGVEGLDKSIAEAKEHRAEARQKARELDVPPANIALFRKYEPEIKKYAMGGLEWLGL